MEDSPSKPSVAELAGRLKGHILPMPSSNDEVPCRRRPPRSLGLQRPRQDSGDVDKTPVSPNPPRVRVKNSPVVERLQANLALSPTALLPSPKSPEGKLQPTTPCSPLSPTLQLSTEEEDPVSFDSPPEGAAPLHSINKTRARLSFKRRPPTRQHRRSAGEEAGPFGGSPSPREPHGPNVNGDQQQGVEHPAEEDEHTDVGATKEADEQDRDCEQTEEEEEEEAAGGDRGGETNPEREQASGQAQSQEASEEEQAPSKPCPAEQTGGDVETEEAGGAEG